MMINVEASGARIPISDFKARCLGLLAEVAANGGELVVTRRGADVVRVTSMKAPPLRPLHGGWKDLVEISGDLDNHSTAHLWEVLGEAPLRHERAHPPAHRRSKAVEGAPA